MELSKKLTDKLIDLELINDDDKELYYYGFEQGFLLLLNFMTLIIIGIIFNMVWQSIIFITAYSVLRSYAGGYHTGDKLKCYLFSIVMIIIVLWLIRWIPLNEFIYFIITVISSMIILIMAPVEDSNKPLDSKEKKVFKKRSNIILGVLIGLTLLFWLMGKKQVSLCIIMAICTSSFMLVLGKITK